jgi:archaellum biogenesis ATPase FlaH
MATYKKSEFEETEILELPEETVEKIICKQLLKPECIDNSVFVRQHFLSSWFKDTHLGMLYSFLLKYWQKYESAPTKELLNEILMNEHFEEHRAALKNKVSELYSISEDNWNPKFIQDSIIDFTKGRAVYYAILDNIEEIENRGDIRNCLYRLENIVKIGISDDLGIEYFENLNNHIQDLTNKEERMLFGWKDWDKFTYGGMPIGEACLFIIMAQPGLGKSQTMMNIGYNLLMQDKNVLMVSLEMSEKMYSRRMSALFTGINVNKLKDHTEILKKRVTTTKLSIPHARLYIKQYSPNEFNSIKLKNLLKKYKETKDFVPDLIIVDYLNIMSTNVSSAGMKSYERVGTISKELRSVSIETKIPILSATQSNRCLHVISTVVEKTKGNIPIVDVVEGDQLLSIGNKWNTVVKKYPVDIANTYRIKTNTGRCIICTANHMWPTKAGFKSYETGLAVGDSLIVGTFLHYFKRYEQIVEIVHVGKNKVVDIEVSGDHLFYANGVLTHNSGSGSGYAGEDISMNNTSDSAGINMDADAIFALYQLEGERELGRINVKILKNRLGGFVDTIFPMSVNYETLKISDWDSTTESETDMEVFQSTEQNIKSSDDKSMEKLFENLG